MTATTPVYGIEYLVQGEPARATRLALENNAKTIEAALIRGGIAPAEIQDLIAAGWFTDTGLISIAPNAGYTLGSQGARYSRAGRVVDFTVHLISTAAMPANGTMLTLPAGSRPRGLRWLTTASGKVCDLTTAGVLRHTFATAAGEAIAVSGTFLAA